jgi:hypothetical protein
MVMFMLMVMFMMMLMIAALVVGVMMFVCHKRKSIT